MVNEREAETGREAGNPRRGIRRADKEAGIGREATPARVAVDSQQARDKVLKVHKWNLMTTAMTPAVWSTTLLNWVIFAT